MSLVNELFRPKYENVTFYCDNLGGNDIVYILNTLDSFNDNYLDKKKESDKSND